MGNFVVEQTLKSENFNYRFWQILCTYEHAMASLFSSLSPWHVNLEMLKAKPIVIWAVACIDDQAHPTDKSMVVSSLLVANLLAVG
ncbi:hypothetical protein VNO78_31850 [Psophocarpus tetragonolobus]|uniref:Uncharacterized protein n=1 Tax=Psophocarpus tetragonolobus TaxID=3891 RepID=A0AAN9RYP8_PSOTE